MRTAEEILRWLKENDREEELLTQHVLDIGYPDLESYVNGLKYGYRLYLDIFAGGRFPECVLQRTITPDWYYRWYSTMKGREVIKAAGCEVESIERHGKDNDYFIVTRNGNQFKLYTMYSGDRYVMSLVTTDNKQLMLPEGFYIKNCMLYICDNFGALPDEAILEILINN